MPPTAPHLDGRPARGERRTPSTVFHANAPPLIKRRDVARAALRMARTSAFVPRAAVVRPVPSPRRSWLRLFAFERVDLLLIRILALVGAVVPFLRHRFVGGLVLAATRSGERRTCKHRCAREPTQRGLWLSARRHLRTTEGTHALGACHVSSADPACVQVRHAYTISRSTFFRDTGRPKRLAQECGGAKLAAN